MSPGPWQLTVPTDAANTARLPTAQRAKHVVVSSLRYLDGQNGLPLYTTPPWLQKAKAVAVTTLPISSGLVRALSRGRQTLDLPSVCLGARVQ